jgi:hypothetical protein
VYLTVNITPIHTKKISSVFGTPRDPRSAAPIDHAA